MSGPPDDLDPNWQDLRKQVERALEEAGLSGGNLDEAVLEGVRQAFSAIDDLTSRVGAGTGEPEAGPPDVQVMDGGRADAPKGEPRGADTENRPGLRLAPDLDEVLDSSEAPGPQGSLRATLRPDVRIAVRRVGPERTTVRRPSGVGDIRRRGGIAVEQGASQTLYQGAAPRLYRVSCTDGSLRLELEGQPTCTLLPGQSTDVDARLLLVHGLADGLSAGVYTLVRVP